jgi:hypothetical protein
MHGRTYKLLISQNGTDYKAHSTHVPDLSNRHRSGCLFYRCMVRANLALQIIKHAVFPLIDLRMLDAEFLYYIINPNPRAHFSSNYFFIISYYGITFLVFSNNIDVQFQAVEYNYSLLSERSKFFFGNFIGHVGRYDYLRPESFIRIRR